MAVPSVPATHGDKLSFLDHFEGQCFCNWTPRGLPGIDSTGLSLVGFIRTICSFINHNSLICILCLRIFFFFFVCTGFLLWWQALWCCEPAWLFCGVWDLLLRPRMEPTSPTLEGRFLTTGPPGESLFDDV